MFPPALVPLLRDRVIAKAGSLAEVADHVLVQLLTTIFWAGLETYEGERNPIGVAFLGTSRVDVVTSDAAGADAPFLYQWKVQHFESPRPFAVGELVKLAVAGADRRIYSAVNVLPDGSLVIAGLAREGFSVVSDPFVKIIASRPGCLSIRRGRDLAARVRAGRHSHGRRGRRVRRRSGAPRIGGQPHTPPTWTTMPSPITWTRCVRSCGRWRRTAAAAS